MNSTEIYNTTKNVDPQIFAVSPDGTKSALVEVTNQENEDFAKAITVIVTNHQSNAQQQFTLDAALLDQANVTLVCPVHDAVTPLIAFFHQPMTGPQVIVVGTSSYFHIWTLEGHNTYSNITLDHEFATAFTYDPRHSHVYVAYWGPRIISKVTIDSGRQEHFPLDDGTHQVPDHGKSVTGIVVRADTSLMVNSHDTDISWYKLGADGTKYVLQKFWSGGFNSMSCSPNCDATFAIEVFTNVAGEVRYRAVKIYPRDGRWEMEMFCSGKISLQKYVENPKIVGITKDRVYVFHVLPGHNSAIQKLKHCVKSSTPIKFMNDVVAPLPHTMYGVIGGEVAMVGNSNQLIVAYSDGNEPETTFVHRFTFP